MRPLPLNYIFIVVVFILFSLGLNLQVKAGTCNLRLNVFEYKTKKLSDIVSTYIMDETTLLPDAKAVVINIRTKQVFRSSLFGRTPYFRNLDEGTYYLTTSKVGYKQTKQKITVDCQFVNSEYIFCEKVLLRKGNINQIVNESPVASIGDPGGCYYTPSEIEQFSGKSSTDEIFNDRAVILKKPPYPAAARAVRASGQVTVEITIDKQGNVISALAISGHPLLQGAAEKAAMESKFSPVLVKGKPVKVTGVIVYNFVP